MTFKRHPTFSFHRNRALHFFGVLGILVVTACQTSRPARTSNRMVDLDGRSVTANDAAYELLERGRKLRADGDAVGAEAALREIHTRFSDAASYQESRILLAEICLESSRPDEAKKIVERVLVDEPNGEHADRAKYVLAMSQLQTGNAKDAAPALEDIVNNMPTQEKKVEAAEQLSEKLSAQGQGAEALRYMYQAYEMSTGPEKQEREQALVDVVDNGISFTDLRRISEEGTFRGTLVEELLAFKLVRVFLHLREAAAAKEQLSKYRATFPDGRFASEAAALDAQFSGAGNVDGARVGVILPLSGKYQSYGQRVLSSILLGAGINTKGKPGRGTYRGSKVTFVVVDSKGTAEGSASAVHELVVDKNAIAIVGDILLDTALPIARLADQYGVPLISLSRQAGVPELSRWVFRLGFTPEKQARILAEVAMTRLGMTRFGIIYPRHSYGLEMMNAFWDEVEKRNGEVTAIESYPHDQTNFTYEAKSVVGRLNLYSRGQFGACRSRAKGLRDAYSRKKALEKCGDAVKPVVDFQALLIPDDFRTVSFVVPALVAEDILVTDNASRVSAFRQTTGSRSRSVKLMGGSLWHNNDIEKRLGREIDGAILVDGFSVESGRPAVARFVQNFKSKYRSKPGLLEAHGHDAGALVLAIIGEDAPNGRAAFRDALQATTKVSGVTGKIKFAPSGDSATEPVFFEMEAGELQRIENLDSLGRPNG